MKAVLLFLFSLSALAQPCEKEGLVRNSNGRCVVSNSTVEIQIAARACEGQTGEELSECMEKVAKDSVAQQLVEQNQATTDGGFDKAVFSSTARYGMPALATSYVAFYFLENNEKLNKCASWSMGLLLAGAVASAITEIVAHNKYKNGLEAAQTSYNNEVDKYDDTADSSEDYTELQMKAFEYMIAQEVANQDALIARKKGYRVASFAYYGASAAAIWELTQGMGTGKCQNPANASYDSLNQRLDSSSLYSFTKEIPEIHIYKEISIKEFTELVSRKIFSEIGISSSYAQDSSGGVTPTELKKEKIDLKGILSIISNKGGNALKGLKKAISKGINNPTGRIVLTGMMATYAEIMVQKTIDNIVISQTRVDALEATMLSYTAGGGNGLSLCSEADRDNQAKPECYCYNSDQTKNTMRAERPVCVSYLNGTSPLVAANYNNINDGYESAKACITIKQKFESHCQSCKKNKKLCNFINKGLGRLDLGKAKWARGAASLLNKFNSGSLGGALFNFKPLEAKAFRMQAIRNGLLDKNPRIKKNTDNAIKRLIASNTSAFNKMAASNPSFLKPADLGTSPLALKKFKDPKKNEIMANVRAKYLKSGNAKSLKGGSATFDLGLGDSGGSLIEDDITMNDEYKITGDINTNSSKNIFKILSNRYQRSGLRRLFDIDNKSQADEATGLEINGQ